MNDKFIDIALYISYFLLIASIILGILLPLISAFGNIKSLIKGLMGIGLIAVVFLVSFAFSGGEVTPEFIKFGIGATFSKIIGAGLISMYILVILSFISIILTEIIKLIK